MQIKRHAATGLVAVTVGLAALATGCGGSSTTVTPLETSTTARTQTTLGPPASGSGVKSTPSTAEGSTATTAPNAASNPGKPSPAQLAGLQRALDDAGSSLAAGGNAIAGADVNQAKTQEGSAP